MTIKLIEQAARRACRSLRRRRGKDSTGPCLTRRGLSSCTGRWPAKGDDTKERPHRLSKILKAPKSFEVVSAEQLRALADELPPAGACDRLQAGPQGGGFDLEAFLVQHGVAVAEAHH